MAKFTEKLKQQANNVWTKVRPYGSYLLSLLFLVIIAGTTYSLVHKKDQPAGPDVAVNYEPRIGEPLPPDVNPDAQSGSTTNPTSEQTTYLAPTTGIDDNGPINYWNDQWQFAATLPPHTEVTENSDGANFGNYYSVAAAKAGPETLQSIAEQLRNSPDVKSLMVTPTEINFTTASQKGIVIIKNGIIYYLLGNQFLETFHTT